MGIKSKMTQKTIKQLEKIAGEKLTLGRFIWAIRMSDDITQVAFAEKLKISRQQLCDIEHNRKAISPALAGRYAEILKYSKEQFIRLSLQDLVDREGLHVTVDVHATRWGKGRDSDELIYAD